MSYCTPRKHRRSVAILLAGPIFVTTALLTQWQSDPAAVVPLLPDARIVLGTLMFMLAASAFGAIIAIVPVMIGSAAMQAFGRATRAGRLPVVWGLAGALLASIPVLLMPESRAPDVFWFGPALIATGALCALLCRRCYAWDESEHDAALSEARSPAICLTHDT